MVGREERGTAPFDLNVDAVPAFSSATQSIEGTLTTFNENSVTDWGILCFYAYSELYEGDQERRKELLDRHVSDDDDNPGGGDDDSPSSWTEAWHGQWSGHQDHYACGGSDIRGSDDMSFFINAGGDFGGRPWGPTMAEWQEWTQDENWISGSISQSLTDTTFHIFYEYSFYTDDGEVWWIITEVTAERTGNDLVATIDLETSYSGCKETIRYASRQ